MLAFFIFRHKSSEWVLSMPIPDSVDVDISNIVLFRQTIKNNRQNNVKNRQNYLLQIPRFKENHFHRIEKGVNSTPFSFNINKTLQLGYRFCYLLIANNYSIKIIPGFKRLYVVGDHKASSELIHRNCCHSFA